MVNACEVVMFGIGIGYDYDYITHGPLPSVWSVVKLGEQASCTDKERNST